MPRFKVTNKFPCMTLAPSLGFITVTVGGPTSTDHRPGDYDLAVPLYMSGILATAAQKSPPNSIARTLHLTNWRRWYTTAVSMRRPNMVPWWRRYPLTTIHDEMTYECDENLGNPAAADCTDIEWNQLGSPSDSLTLESGNTKFFHSGTCYLAVSARLTMVLGWDQIQTALATLMGICIQLPSQAAHGGRAYFGSSSLPTSGRRKKRQTSLTGLNALPPHVNLTLFQQTEPWTNPAEELTSCTWKAAWNRKAISSCRTA